MPYASVGVQVEMTVSAMKTEIEAMNDNRAFRRKFTAVAAGILAPLLGAGLFIEHKAHKRLEQEVTGMRLQLAWLTAFQQEFSNRLAQAAQPAPPLLRPTEIDLSELMRLRAEIRQLRDRLMQVERVSEAVSNRLAEASGANTPFVYADSTKRKDYAFSGYAAPQSAFQSMLWAITQSDVKAYRESLGPEMAAMFAEQYKDMPEGVMPGGFKNGMMYKASASASWRRRRLGATPCRRGTPGTAP